MYLYLYCLPDLESVTWSGQWNADPFTRMWVHCGAGYSHIYVATYTRQPEALRCSRYSTSLSSMNCDAIVTVDRCVQEHPNQKLWMTEVQILQNTDFKTGHRTVLPGLTCKEASYSIQIPRQNIKEWSGTSYTATTHRRLGRKSNLWHYKLQAQ